MSNYIVDSSAIVDNGAQIGDHSHIWHFSHICAGAKIGHHCSLGQNVFVANGVVIGNNVKIQNNVSIYDGVFLEDNVFCGPSVVFTNVINPRSQIIRKNEYRKTVVQHGASIGANATIICGINIGQYAFIAAGAVVSRDVAPYTLVMGIPAKFKSYICYCGIKLQFKNNEALCTNCALRYIINNQQCKLLEEN